MRRVWRFARWLVLLEISIWKSLGLWLLRQVPGRTPTADAFPYANQVTPLLLAFTFASALEIPVAHLLIPWEPVRMVLLLAGVWGLLWMLGYLASMRVYQHLIDDEGILIRSGARTHLRLRWNVIGDVRTIRANTSTDRALHIEGTTADAPMLKQVRIEIRLSEPITINKRAVTRVRLYADDPKRFVASARGRLAVRATPSAA